MRAVRTVVICTTAFALGQTGAPQMALSQTLNDGFAAMEVGDFFTAFSAMRRLEQAGDPNAARLLEQVFRTPSVQPVAAPAMPVAAYRRPAPAQVPPSGLSPVAVAPPPAVRAPVASGRPAPPVPPHTLPAPLTGMDFHHPDPGLASIGRLLFFDPVLSGNKDTSCATCHHPRHASGDGVSLGLGTGAQGLGRDRSPTGARAAQRRIPRNAPALWNLGARDIRVLFHDGRVELDPARPGHLLTPQGPLDYMALETLLAAQALFPVLSAEEMAGKPGENPIADAVSAERVHGDDGAWALLAARVDALEPYSTAFAALRGAPGAVRIEEIANALGAFIAREFRADQTPFDLYLRETGAMPPEAGEGMRLFYGRANCAACHSGPLLSDQQFHAMGQPPLGPGKDRDAEGYTRDLGRGFVTLDPDDAYRFRTPMLRNVVHTGPWGHSGAFSDLADFLRHHLDPVAGLAAYAPQAILPDLEVADGDYAAIASTRARAAIADAAARDMALRPQVIVQDDEIALLIAFLATLSDQTALAGRSGVPASVPSGLMVDQ